jgi:uncharacterized surface protein with fasciclin (FAS1) repeats
MMLLLPAAVVVAFVPTTPSTIISIPSSITTTTTGLYSDRSSSTSDDYNNNNSENTILEGFIRERYPSFHSLISLNPGIWKTMAESERGVTLFVPNERAFQNLGDKKLSQLRDVRNEETAQKMGGYHVVLQAVTAAQLRTEDWTGPKPIDDNGRGTSSSTPRPTKLQALINMYGDKISVGRKKSGGTLFGWGAKEEGEIVVGSNQNKSPIVQSFKIEGGKFMVHEVEEFLFPDILWRYCDQLRIPGF